MNFLLGKEQSDIKKAANEFARRLFEKDNAADFDETGRFPADILVQAARYGFIGVDLPIALGGQGLGAAETIIVLEEFCRVDSGIGICLGLCDYGSDLIAKHLSSAGNQAAAKAMIEKIAAGESICTLLLGPACDTGGYHLQRLPAGGHPAFTISGHFECVVNAGLADTVIAVMPFTEAPGVVEKYVIGILEPDDIHFVIKKSELFGMRMTPVGDLTLENAPLRESRIIELDDGKIFEEGHFSIIGHIRVAAMAIGIAQGALDRALNYAKKRMAFGKPIGQFQAIQHYLSNMQVEIEVSRLLTQKAAALYDQGLNCIVEACMAKTAASKTAQFATARAMQVFAGYGYTLEYDIQRYWRDAKALDCVPLNKETTQYFLRAGADLYPPSIH